MARAGVAASPGGAEQDSKKTIDSLEVPYTIHISWYDTSWKQITTFTGKSSIIVKDIWLFATVKDIPVLSRFLHCGFSLLLSMP